jgi:DNA-binding LacI/PurR family transcriptional regulator
MKDVATKAGVAQSTVSRVLNDAPSPVAIAPTTRDRIFAAARDLSYRPNPLARALRGMKTMLLGVIVADITDPFFGSAMEAASIEASRRGYNIVLGHARGTDDPLVLWRVLEARRCDAIVLLGDIRDQPRMIEDLCGAPIPVVAVGPATTWAASIGVDNWAGVAALLDHLVGLGHHRIGFIAGHRRGDILEREEAYIDYMTRLNGPPPEGYRQHATDDTTGGGDALEAILDLPDPPTAVIASTDVLAMGVLHAAHERGIRVPDHLSVTGFGDVPLAAFTVPAMTTVRVHVPEMVTAAIRVALEDDDGSGISGRPLARLVEPSLVVRRSTGPRRLTDEPLDR